MATALDSLPSLKKVTTAANDAKEWSSLMEDKNKITWVI